jgi:hypothetical protein
MEHLYYSLDDNDRLVSDPDESDRYRNCAEWLAACDPSVAMDDIYKIQYDTPGELFVATAKTDVWEENFGKNTFVQFLVKKENKNLLDYMLFAKKMELTEIQTSYRFEEWESQYRYGEFDFEPEGEEWNKENIQKIKRDLFETAQKKLKEAPTTFLQQRYAFQICRLQYQLNKEDNGVYAKYFGNVKPNNLMSVWAGFFHAQNVSTSLNDRYRFLTRVFINSAEKKFRCVQLFTNLYEKNPYNADSLTHTEQSIANVMLAACNPGRAIDQIRQAYTLDANNIYLPFLVSREINKLEDWLITPLFYGKYSMANSDPFACAYSWWEEYKEQEGKNSDEMGEKLQAENLATDNEYLMQLKSFLEEILPKTNGEVKDYYTISLAHLSLLQENTADTRRYLSKVSSGANVTIQLQKKLETIWLAIKTQDVNSKAFETIFVQNIADLERISTPGYENKHLLYTLTLTLANEYLKKGNRLYGNLLRMKSDVYHQNWYAERTPDNYATIAYFDKNATISDMDKLIALIEKKNKTSYESTVCDQIIPSLNACKELKGTIAFRNNDLQLAYDTFASMPTDYWTSNNFLFSYYLNEDPFIPKGLRANKYRKFDYKFNKAEFVKELIDLQKQITEKETNRADAYIRLGNAYFNTSYWGNAWMMTRYGSSVGDIYYSKTECLPQWMADYMTADIARRYFEKALSEANSDEQRAYASVMLFSIHQYCYDFKEIDEDKTLAFQYGNRFRQYNKTQVFKLYDCPGIRLFLK